MNLNGDETEEASTITSGWRALAASVRGASHERVGKPNQDAVGFRDGAWGALVAVADGHGSAVCVRSDRGSKYAVQATFELLGRLIDGPVSHDEIPQIELMIREEAPQKLVERWQRLVEGDLAVEPLSADEISRSDEAAEPHASSIESHALLAYGSTLLICIATDLYIALLQVGDGDIVSVDAEGKAVRPLPNDPRLIANETTSLSGEQAWRNFRTGFIPLAETPIQMVLLSSDGYANSYAGDSAFFRVVTDILGNISRAGVERVKQELPSWLQDATNRGSGDDISAGLLFQELTAGCEDVAT